MELYIEILIYLDLYLIYCLFPLTLIVILTELIFKNRFQTKQILNLIKWVIIYYTIVFLIYFIIKGFFSPNGFKFLNRADGPYWWAYWIMILCSTILPFTLFYKKLAQKPWYLLLVAVLMKIGAYIDTFVIIITDFQPAYGPFKFNRAAQINGLIRCFSEGFILAVILIGIFELLKWKKNRVQQF